MTPEVATPRVADTIAKYFFFTTLDERLSFAAAIKVLAELKNNDWMDPQHRARWIETLSKWHVKARSLSPRDWSASESARGYTLAKGVDLSLWVSFRSSGEPSEIEAVLLSKVLGFRDEEIAEGLHVTPGTIRYRVGRGLRHLGGYIES